MLQDRIELTRDQIESLRERTAETGRSIGETDRQRQELVEENERLEAASASIRETVVGLEARTRALVARLPDPAKERVNLLVQRLPRDPESTELSLSDRFLDVVGILNELDKFNREITVTSEVHALEGGRSLEVAALYVGLGQGYYVSPDGKLAGVGRPTENGWSWTLHDDAAAEIAKAIAILEDGDVADFVNLPLRVE
jgi:FtsZ-binding cell division protein ZapB